MDANSEIETSNSPSLAELFLRQHQLQRESFKLDPCLLSGSEQAEFVRWNVLALEDELHEALAEVNWKPWATAEPGVRDYDAFLGELVDAFHFLMNLALVAGFDPEQAAHAFAHRYAKKADRNAERQEEGYTGLAKCPRCHRDYMEGTVIYSASNTYHCRACGAQVPDDLVDVVKSLA